MRDSHCTLSKFLLSLAAGFAPEALQLEHLPFGTMLGKDGKPFKTRQGGIIKLADLLDEAERRQQPWFVRKTPTLNRPACTIASYRARCC